MTSSQWGQRKTTNGSLALSADVVSHPPERQPELDHRRSPLPRSTTSARDNGSGVIAPSLDLLQLVIHHPITRMPHLPEPHRATTARATRRIPACAGQYPLAVGLPRHHPIRALDRPPHRHQNRFEERSYALMLAGRMQTIIADTMKPLGQNVLHQATDKPQHRHLYLFTFTRLVVAVPITHSLPIIAQDAPKRDRRAHHVLRQIICQTLATSWHLPFLQVRHQPTPILPPQRVDLLLHLLRPNTGLQHRAQMILPLLVQHFEGKVAHLEPPMLRRHAARGHQDMEMRVPITSSPPCLQDHHIACLQRAPLEPRQRLTQHLDSALHQISSEGPIMKERHAQGIRDGQHHMTIGYPFVERPANMAHPLVDVHLTARQTKAALAAKRHPFLFQAVLTQIDAIARSRIATAEHLRDDLRDLRPQVVAITLPEHLPVIAEDLFEGLFVHAGCWGVHMDVCTTSDQPSPPQPRRSQGQRHLPASPNSHGAWRATEKEFPIRSR